MKNLSNDILMQGDVDLSPFVNPIWQKSVGKLLGMTLGNWVVANPFMGFTSKQYYRDAAIVLVKKFKSLKLFKKAKKRIAKKHERILANSPYFCHVEYDYIEFHNDDPTFYILCDFMPKTDLTLINVPIFHKIPNKDRVLFTQSHIWVEVPTADALTIKLDEIITSETIAAGKIQNIGRYNIVWNK